MDMHEALNNWGTALAGQARLKGGAEADELFKQAGGKYAEALKIKPDRNIYFNMAIPFALHGDVDAALRWLGQWADGNPEATRLVVETDRDFDNIRETEKFRNFVKKLL